MGREPDGHVRELGSGEVLQAVPSCRGAFVPPGFCSRVPWVTLLPSNRIFQKINKPKFPKPDHE
ncbi:unnamed protein product [Chondrus crispus]|uniref:Uncharacterized protein n=1 Tax=Chondrus crispus TaxID=2769 RepID=R7QCG8_CHOCR|nr:unnamed protein product [Chondrus crispus]CDF35769.1 unnamed protein product [Chondrus crispus]|eukprot:XP_005715588.1 unnamed protein product [Chondrus crispus]